MNWGEFKAEIVNRLQDDNIEGLIPGWYRSAATILDSSAEWRSLDRRKVIPTVAPYSTGTVSATNGSTTVTLSGGTFPSDCAGQILSFTSDGTYYDISTRVGDAEITLGSAYIGTTGSSKTYKVVNYKVTPPTGWDPQRAYSVTLQAGSGSHQLLAYLTDLEALEDSPDEIINIGTPYGFRMFSDQAVLVPPPDAAYNMVWLYKMKPTMFDDDTADETAFEWNDAQVEVLVLWVWEIGLTFLNNGAMLAVQAQRKEALANEIRRNNQVPSGRARLMQVSMLKGERPVRPARYADKLG